MNKNVPYLSSSLYNFFNLTSVIGLRATRNLEGIKIRTEQDYSDKVLETR